MIDDIGPKVWNAVADLLSERGTLPASADVVAETGCEEPEAYKAIQAYARYHGLPAKPAAETIAPRQVWEAAFQAETALCRAIVEARDRGVDPSVLEHMTRARDLARETTRRALLAIPGPEQRQRGASWRLG